MALNKMKFIVVKNDADCEKIADKLVKENDNSYGVFFGVFKVSNEELKFLKDFSVKIDC